MVNNTDIQPKISIDEMSSMAILWVLNTNDTKNCCLALVSKLQEVAFMYKVL